MFLTVVTVSTISVVKIGLDFCLVGKSDISGMIFL